MMEQLHHFRLLRITLEAASAHAIHAGKGDTTHDVLLVRDANGLPTLPGSSLAGVLRHAFASCHGDDTANRLFGDPDTHCASRLQVGWGLVHDSHDQPVEGLRENITEDPLLQLLADAKPLVRDRVHLNQRGSAEDEGKFDTTLIPAGVRYTTLIGCWDDDSETAQADWQSLLSLLRQPVRLGHGTRTGAGLFHAVRLHAGEWDLTIPEQAEAYRTRPRSRAETQQLRTLDTITDSDGQLTVTLDLKAEGGWRIGGGETPLPGTLKTSEKVPDMLPMHEYRIEWRDGHGQPGHPRYLLPASAIKGALRHRVAYHYRCLTGQFANAMDTLPEAGACEAVQTLFGYTDGDSGQPGLLYIDDITIANSDTTVLMHNRLDRFTGGVVRGGLFGEQVLWDTTINLRITLDSATQGEVPPDMRRALQATLNDLTSGWLPLGAAGSRGLGTFTGNDPLWSDGGDWINAGTSQTEAV